MEMEEEEEEEEEKEEEEVEEEEKYEISNIFQHSLKTEWNRANWNFNRDFFMYGYTVGLLTESIYEADNKKYINLKPTWVPREKYKLWTFQDADFNSTYLLQVEGKNIGDVLLSGFSDNKNKNFIHLEPNCIPKDIDLNSPETLKDKYFIYTMPGKEPDPCTGAHTSDLVRLLGLGDSLLWKMMINDLAHLNRADPRILIQKESAGGKTEIIKMYNQQFDLSKNTMVNNPMVQPPSSFTDISDSATKKNMTDSTESLKQMFTHYKSNRRQIFDRFQSKRMIPVPGGYELASGGAPIAEPISDMLQHIDAYRDLVFAVLGLPVTMVFPQVSTKYGTTTNNDLDNADNNRLNRALRIYQHMLIDIAKDIYSTVYTQNNAKVDIDLPIYCPITTTQAALLADLNVISSDHAKLLMYQGLGLNPTKMFNGKNVNDRPRPGGNELMTSTFMAARIGNINGETKTFEKQLSVMDANTAKLKAEATDIKKNGTGPAAT